MSDGGTWGRDDEPADDRPQGSDPPEDGGWGDGGSSAAGWGDQGQQPGTPGDPGQQPGGGWGDTGQQPGGGWGAPGQQPGGQWGGGPNDLPPPPSGTGSNGKAIAALACGLASLVFLILFFPLGFLLAIAAIVLGILGIKDANRTRAGGKGMAISGIVTGGVTLLLLILGAIGIAAFLSQFDSDVLNDPEGFLEELQQEGFVDEEGNVVEPEGL